MVLDSYLGDLWPQKPEGSYYCSHKGVEVEKPYALLLTLLWQKITRPINLSLVFTAENCSDYFLGKKKKDVFWNYAYSINKAINYW